MTPTTRRSSASQPRMRRRAAHTVRALAALGTLLALVAGIPALLAGTIGNPADGWSALTAGDLSDQVVLDVLAAVAWIAWAQFALSVLIEAVAAARQLPTPHRLPLVPGSCQQLARTLIASALLLSTATAAVAAAAPSAHAAGQVAVATIPASPTSAGPAVPAAVRGARQGADAAAARPEPAADSPTEPAPAPAPATAPARTYTVRVDGPDTYWDIAETFCGGGQYWRSVWVLNEGRSQPDGRVMSSPDLLRAGWTVLLPPVIRPAVTAAAPGIGPVEVVTVHRGDTLSGLAAERGQPDWQQAWAVSKNRLEPGGARFTDPNLIRPGWTVEIPTGHIPAAGPSAPAAAMPSAVTPTPAAVPTPPSAPPRLQHAPANGALTPATVALTPAAPVGPTLGGPAEHPAQELDGSATVAPMVAFGAGGGLLAAVCVVGLMVNRRRQFRWRRPGRTITSAAHTSGQLQRTEQALLAAAGPSGPDVAWLDTALRGLAAEVAATPEGTLPDVVAVRMTDDVLELILTEPHPGPPAPWTVDVGGGPGTRWSLRREDTPVLSDDVAARHFAPFPMLVSVGHTAGGQQWLLDLERIGVLSLSGDPRRCLDLARFIAAELAHNTWSEMLTLTLAGFGEELAELNPERLAYSSDHVAAIRSLHHQFSDVSGIAGQLDVGVLTGRLRDIDGDVWAPHALLLDLDPNANDSTGGAGSRAAVRPAIEGLLAAMQAGRGRSSVALVVCGESLAGQTRDAEAPRPRWRLVVSADGRTWLPDLGVELIVQQLPADEAAGLAQLLALSADLDGRPMPPARGGARYDLLADAAGGLRPEVLTGAASADGAPRPAEPDPPGGGADPFDSLASPPEVGSGIPPANPARAAQPGPEQRPDGQVPALGLASNPPWLAMSMLPLPTQSYLERTPVTAGEIEALAPAVPARVRAQLAAADTALAADLSAWNDPNSPRPKVRLLGPVGVRSIGALHHARPRLAWNTELAAYLATHPAGVPAGQFAADVFPGEAAETAAPKLRKAVTSVRAWLGADPETGRDYLPKGRPGGAPGGTTRYGVTDVLVDAELFRRLRLAALSRGAEGIDDLWTALRLVSGPPFTHDRPGGYTWLATGHDDHVYAAMIFEVAHTVATHHLAAGEPLPAAQAAQIALLAGSQEDTALLDLMFASDGQGNHTEGDLYRKRILDNHGAGIPEDCPPSTAQALLRRERMRRADSCPAGPAPANGRPRRPRPDDGPLPDPPTSW